MSTGQKPQNDLLVLREHVENTSALHPQWGVTLPASQMLALLDEYDSLRQQIEAVLALADHWATDPHALMGIRNVGEVVAYDIRQVVNGSSAGDPDDDGVPEPGTSVSTEQTVGASLAAPQTLTPDNEAALTALDPEDLIRAHTRAVLTLDRQAIGTDAFEVRMSRLREVEAEILRRISPGRESDATDEPLTVEVMSERVTVLINDIEKIARQSNGAPVAIDGIELLGRLYAIIATSGADLLFRIIESWDRADEAGDIAEAQADAQPDRKLMTQPHDGHPDTEECPGCPHSPPTPSTSTERCTNYREYGMQCALAPGHEGHCVRSHAADTPASLPASVRREETR